MWFKVIPNNLIKEIVCGLWLDASNNKNYQFRPQLTRRSILVFQVCQNKVWVPSISLSRARWSQTGRVTPVKQRVTSLSTPSFLDESNDSAE